MNGAVSPIVPASRVDADLALIDHAGGAIPIMLDLVGLAHHGRDGRRNPCRGRSNSPACRRSRSRAQSRAGPLAASAIASSPSPCPRSISHFSERGQARLPTRSRLSLLAQRNTMFESIQVKAADIFGRVFGRALREQLGRTSRAARPSRACDLSSALLR
jgi:hypothetical protein